MKKIINQYTLSKVAILMAVYNGEKYLSQQLQSFLDQKECSWRLYISDDGSDDNTIEIIRKFQNQIGRGRVNFYKGPSAGFARNFLKLITDPDIKAEYYALSDQDDVWEENKLSTAIKILDTIEPTIPALYCGRTIFVDQDCNYIGLSDKPVARPSFKNALVQNIASGNTMVYNNAARDLLINCCSQIDIYAHDWLIYLLISGAGGVVYYDETPHLRYRQHSSNQIGMNSTIKNKFKRFNQLLNGEFSKWTKKNINALNTCSNILDNKNTKILKQFERATTTKMLPSVYYLYKSGVSRQRLYQNLALYFSAFIGRL